MPVELAQTGSAPLMEQAGVGFTVTFLLLDAPLPQILVGVTLTFPEVEPQVNVMELVPCPEVMLAPLGTVQA